MQTIILGLGNELLGDEGVGVHAARLLQGVKLPLDAKVIEVGTSILNSLPDWEEAGRIIVVDAMKGDGTPGTIYKIPLEDCSGSPCIASMHGFDIFRVMSLVGRKQPPPVTVFGVEPALIHWSMSLSPQVAASLPFLITAVQEELMGYD
jgi:hydrogenase maturation protease